MFNKAILIGRLTADPELKQTPSGTYMVRFQIAMDRRFKSQDGERKSDFIPVVAWRQDAEFICKYFRKGKPIGVEGSIQSRNYEDQNGNKRTAIEVVAERAFFVGSKSENDGGGHIAQSSAPAAPVAYSNGADEDFKEVEIDKDLPF